MRAKLKYGCRPSRPHIANLHFRIAAPEPLPSSFDPRYQHPPAYNQLEEGACTGHAWARMVQWEWIRSGRPNAINTVPARQFIYYNERALELTTAVDAGAELHDGGRALQQWGVPEETLWPYIEDQFAVKPTAAVYEAAKTNCIKEWAQVPQAEREIKTTLFHGSCVGFGLWAYESLESDETAKSGQIGMPKSTEALIGGHALTLVGWEDSVQCYYGFNSWGGDWGMKGTFLVPFDYIHNPKLASDFCILQKL